VLAILPTNATQTEGNTGTKAFTFTVTRSGNTTIPNNVDWAVTGSGGDPANASDFSGTLPSGTLNFAANDITKTITVNVSGDSVVEPNEGFTVTLSNPTNSASITTATATDTIQNDDVAGITVTPTSGLVTTEAGGQATFSVVLTSQPTANVIIPLSSSDTTEGTVSPTSLTFTSANWNTAQTVTVTGVDDLVVDGNIAYSIITAPATSTDTNYNNFNASDVSVTNNDNDVAGITVTPTSGLVTTEAGGTANFTVKLTSQPTANVTLGLSSSNTAEGIISTPSLTFTPANFNTPQTLTITGIDDLVVDGNIAYSIFTAPASSTDLNFNGFNPTDVSVTNNDNDTAPIGDPVTTIPSGTGRLILGNNLDNTIVGSSSNDTIYGYAGFDRIFGQDGNDYIDGGSGNDSLSGGIGNDTLLGGAGNDSIRGDAGADLLIGGADSDIFVYSSPSEGGDTITDFSGSLDTIRVSQGGFGGGLLPGVLLASQFGLGAAATTSSQRFIYDTATGILRFDIDGNGAGASSILATLTGSPTLSSSNFSIF